MNQRTRLRLTIITGVLLFGLAFVSVLYQMEGVAIACISGVLTIVSSYIWGETKRPSSSKNKHTSL